MSRGPAEARAESLEQRGIQLDWGPNPLGWLLVDRVHSTRASPNSRPSFLAPRIETIYKPLETPEFDELAAQEPRNHWFEDDGARIVLGAGRLVPQEGFQTLIDAVALLRRERLLVLGEGKCRAVLAAPPATRICAPRGGTST